jgi:serine/threonine protein kinase
MGQASQSIRANERYRLGPKPLGLGSYATVFLATERSSGAVVALKRAKSDREATARIRREILAQKSLAHPNIMPIIDHDPGYTWYTMPVARGTLLRLRQELDEESLASILLNIADALEVAHEQGMIHRDIAPTNILALEGSRPGGYRWVVADWGMVNRPSGGTSGRLTRAGGMGTAGFDAPELNDNPSAATAAVDVYSLGRVAAWFLTGKWPNSGHPLLPDGPALRWRVFVKAATEPRIADRLPNMAAVREEVNAVFTVHDEPASQRAAYLLDLVLQGDATKLDELITTALAHQDDVDAYLDSLARVPTAQIRTWTVDSPEQATEVACRMAQHLVTSPWGDRDREYVGTPLSFVQAVMQSLADSDKLGLAQDVASKFFAADVHWQYEPQHQRSIEWLSDLEGTAATMVAYVLATKPQLIEYYRSGLTPRSPELAAILA